MKRTILHLGSMLLLFSLLSAQTLELTGRVVDPQGNPIPSVSVITNLSGVGTQTDSDGDFRLPFSAGVTRITFSSVGFQSRQFDLIAVPDTVILQPTFYRERDIIITADRAREGVTPVPFENFSQDEIARDYTVGEFPLLLESTPNLYAYSDAGSSLGYSYLSIRGFNDKRVSVYINGVPLNDPEDQATYFVDLPDFAATVTDIQVQRGVGNSLYGDASFGGSVNIASNSFARERQATITTGYGQYLSDGEMVGEIAKQSVEYASGMIDGRWAFAGRFSKQKTGGYRHNSWYDGWAYYFALARLDTRSTTEVQIYGGPMRMHLAYYGTSRADLNRDRRTNYLAYDNETDNFNQPHYQLHNVYHLSDKATLSNTFYYIHGRGYYEQLKINAAYGDYNIRPDQVNIDTSTGEPYTEGNFVRQIWVEKDQYGWNPRLDIAHQRGRHTLGGSFYLFNSDHWGEVKFAENLNGDLASGHRYYRYFGDKAVGSIYAQEQYQLNAKLGMLATAQLRYQSYQFEQGRMGAFHGYDYDVNWLFFSPRLGFTYALTDKVCLIANAAVSSRTPTDAEIYDANDPYAMPSLEVTSVAINGDDTTYTFGDPTAESERVINYEVGGRYRNGQSMVGVNLFWMDFTNEIIPYGGINDNTGLPITTNAERSVHAGIELTGETAVTPELTLSGNWSFNYNRVKEYSTTLYLEDDSSYELDLADKKISGFPGYLGNLIADYRTDALRFTWRTRLVGRQYMELANIQSLSIEPYSVSSLSASISLNSFAQIGKLTFSARVDNIFDKKYETSGYGGNYADRVGADVVVDGWAEYYVGAERNFFTQISLELF
ncbi:MAG: TonB-dependent receptor [candidate division Zixibacteria bacterium]|nr:TonB-dependent receptor [candidate division Zixibacteria bacterium]